jgi:endo-1,4-beta-mannosidase
MLSSVSSEISFVSYFAKQKRNKFCVLRNKLVVKRNFDIKRFHKTIFSFALFHVSRNKKRMRNGKPTAYFTQFFRVHVPKDKVLLIKKYFRLKSKEK